MRIVNPTKTILFLLFYLIFSVILLISFIEKISVNISLAFIYLTGAICFLIELGTIYHYTDLKQQLTHYFKQKDLIHF